MASIRREIEVNASPGFVWDAVRDFANVDKRLVPGFVVVVRADDEGRDLTFANGSSARELLVSCDDDLRRLVYAITGGRMTAHSASVQVFDRDSGGCLLVWTTDVLPYSLAGYIGTQMDQAVTLMKATLEQSFQMDMSEYRFHDIEG